MAAPSTTVTPSTCDGNYPLSDLALNEYWNEEYAGSYTCVGFAKMILGATYGLGSTESGDDLTIGSNEGDTIRQILNEKNVVSGGRVTFRLRSDTSRQHSLVVCSKSSTGVIAYDGNRLDDNVIRHGTYTFADMAARYDKCLGAQHHA